jgi:hypothetical protein
MKYWMFFGAFLLQMVKLKAFDKFESTTDALNAATHLVDSKLPKGLRKFLKAQCQGQTLVVADSKLGKAISDKLVCMDFFSLSLSFPPRTISFAYFMQIT